MRSAIVCILFITVIPAPYAPAQNRGIATEDAKLLAEIRDHNELMANAEHLSDVIGPRLTGSAAQRSASDWAEQQFQKYGLVNIHQEVWTISHAWTRGSAEASIVSPIARRIAVASAGWAPGTDGLAQGPVVRVAAASPADLDRYRGKLAGAIVVLDEPQPITPPYARGHPPVQFELQAPYGEPSDKESSAGPFAKTRLKFLQTEGVRAILRDSEKPYNLLDMSNGSAGDYQPGLVPTAFLSHEDYALIWRLLRRGEVRMQLALSNSFSPGPAKTSNTVAEIRGAEKPDEVVILGAHIDSWDLGSGSTDNGTGVVIVLEAARALAKLSPAPKRTIRFILFSGEEQGLVGSSRYVDQHQNELAKISGILVDDTGTGPVVAIGTHENYSDIAATQQILAPIASPLHLLEPKLSRTFGSDYAPFNAASVPAFSCIGDGPEYSETHHSQTDTLDKVSEAGMIQSAQLMAAWAFNAAEYPSLLPRRALKTTDSPSPPGSH